MNNSLFLFCFNLTGFSDKVARHHYYLQMRENVVNYGLDTLNEERAFLLASISLQTDLGNYNQDKHVHNYFNPAHYFPSWVRLIILLSFAPKTIHFFCSKNLT